MGIVVFGYRYWGSQQNTVLFKAQGVEIKKN
jgi:hypothetical protein